MNKKKKSMPGALSVDQIMLECAAIPQTLVSVEGFSAPISMSNVSFEDITSIKLVACSPTDVNARIIAKCCDMDVEQVRQLMNGNMVKFSNLLVAVNTFLGVSISDNDLQKQ